MTSRLIGRAAWRAASWSLVVCAVPWRAGDRCARRPRTSAPRRSGSRARRSTSSTARSATATRATAKATPRRICSPGPRNFTTGKFKVRTTPNGALPTHQDLVNIIRRGMPYTSMPAWPTLSDQQVSDLAYYIKTFSPDFANAENVPKPVPLPSAPGATNETIALGKKLYEETGCVRCHGTLGRGDGPSAPTLKDDCGHPIRAADLAQSWTFRGGSTREDIFRTMSTGFNGTPMPSFVDALTPEQRWAITDFIVSLSGSDGPGYTNLVIAKHVQDPIDLAKGAASFASAPVGALSDHRPDHGARARVPSARDLRHRAGHLRRRVDRAARALARHERAEDRQERAVASGAARRGGSGAGRRRQRAAGRRPIRRSGVARRRPARRRSQDGADAAWPTKRRRPAAPTPSSPTRSRSRFPSQAPTGARKPYFLFGDAQNSVDLWFFDLAEPSRRSSPARAAPTSRRTETRERHRRRELRPGRMVGDLQAAACAVSRAPAFAPGEFMPIAFSVWDGFSRERGNRRGLTVWYSLYVEPEVVPSAVGPMVRTALIILGLELAVIGWVRWRYGSRARGELGGEPSQPAATSA